MLDSTNYTVPQDILQQAVNSIPGIDSRLSLNQPTGRFFNDPWELKSEFKGTVWETILNILDEPKGEARLIKLTPGESYPSHADIDDRWHLALTGNNSYLIDLENCVMHRTDKNGIWYSMNAGRRHTAANFGSEDRIQLVVRKLLPMPNIKNPVDIAITLKTVVEDRRFIFDDIISPWLNYAYKKGIVDNFKGEDLIATMTVESDYVNELTELTKEHFVLAIK